MYTEVFQSRVRRGPLEPSPWGPPVSPADVFQRMHPIPSTEAEWERCGRTKKIDPNDLANEFGLDGLLKFINDSPTVVSKWDSDYIATLGVIDERHPTMRQEVIHGLLRRGETCNFIAAPKTNKSWLALNTAMSIIGGGQLFFKPMFKCVRDMDAKGQAYTRPVLIVDNELHLETIADRARKVADAMNVPRSVANSLIHYMPLRGELADIYELGDRFSKIRRGEYSVIILDALYKIFPNNLTQNSRIKAKFDENSNSDMAVIYCLLDKYADELDAAIICIHHASKGVQAGKSITDMGAGGGAQSRACDAHLTIRPHEEDNVYIIEAVNRSFKPIQPFCARFKFPVWYDEPNADPARYRGMNKKGAEGGADPSVPTWKTREKERIDMFIATITTEKSINEIVDLGMSKGFRPWNRDRMKVLMPTLIAEGKMREVKPNSGRIAATYIAVAQAKAAEDADRIGTEADVKPAEQSSGPPVTESDNPAQDEDEYGLREDEVPF